jgi:ketosteroid isomerase-like protein
VLAALGVALIAVLPAGAVAVTWAFAEKSSPADHPAYANDCGPENRPVDADQVIPPGLLQHDDDEDWRHHSTVCRPALSPWCDTFLHPKVNPRAVASRENHTSGPPERREEVIVYPDTRASRAAYDSMRQMHQSCSDYSEGGIRYEYGQIRSIELGDAAFVAEETHVSDGGDGRRAGNPRQAHYTLVIRIGTALAIYHDHDHDAAIADGTAVAAAMCRYAPAGC